MFYVYVLICAVNNLLLLLAVTTLPATLIILTLRRHFSDNVMLQRPINYRICCITITSANKAEVM